jgi:hypothetical protein
VIRNSGLRHLLSCLFVQNIRMPGRHDMMETMVSSNIPKVGGAGFGSPFVKFSNTEADRITEMILPVNTWTLDHKEC